MTKKINILFLLFFCINPFLRGEEFYYAPNENLPQEIKYIIHSLQVHPTLKNESVITPEKEKKFITLLESLENKMKEIDLENLIFFSKSVCYKTILNKFHHLSIKDSSPTSNIILKLNEIQKKSKGPDLFSNFLIQVIYADFYVILTDKNYDSKDKVTLHKLSYLLPWYDKIQLVLTSPKSFQEITSNLMLEILENLNSTLEIFLSFSEKTNNPVRSFYSKVKWDNAPQTFHGQKITDIVDAVLEQIPDSNFILPSDLPTPINDWKPVENHKEDLEKKSQAVLEHKIDPLYHPPTQLPIPSNDWKLKEKEEDKVEKAVLDQKIDPNYVIPKSLPLPVEKW